MGNCWRRSGTFFLGLIILYLYWVKGPIFVLGSFSANQWSKSWHMRSVIGWKWDLGQISASLLQKTIARSTCNFSCLDLRIVTHVCQLNYWVGIYFDLCTTRAAQLDTKSFLLHLLGKCLKPVLRLSERHGGKWTQRGVALAILTMQEKL